MINACKLLSEIFNKFAESPPNAALTRLKTSIPAETIPPMTDANKARYK